MSCALNNAGNLAASHELAAEAVQTEIVAHGPGLNMVGGDTSHGRGRVAAPVGRPQPAIFSGSGAALSTQSEQVGKETNLLPETRLVAAGIARIV